MNGFGNSTKSCQLKSIETLFLLVASKRIVSIAKVKNLRPRTQDSETRDPENLRLGTLGPCNMGPWDEGPWNSVPGAWKLQP